MTDVTNATAIANINSQTSTAEDTALSGLTSDFENFLSLFLTQLQNQDPTEPLDTNDLTDQIVQFTQVEQQINSNTKLDSIISSLTPNPVTEALDFVGKYVEYESSEVEFDGVGAEFAYQLSSSASDVSIQITNANGTVVREVENLATTVGEKQTVLWDGTDDDGNLLEAGLYTIKVNATASDGSSVSVDTYVTDYVSSVDIEGTEVTLFLGEASIGVDDVVSIKSTSLLQQALANAQAAADAVVDSTEESTEEAAA